MSTIAQYVDVENLLIAFLKAQFPAVNRLVTVLPANLEAQLPLIQVDRIGGADTIPSIDPALIDVECFATLRPAAKALADQVRAALRFTAPGYIHGGAVVAAVTCTVGPSERPYGNPALFRIGATYQVVVHNQA